MFWIIFLFIISGALIIYGGLLSGWRYLHFSFLEPIFNGSPVFFQVWCFVMLIIGAVLFILAISLVFARRKRMMKLYEEYIGEQNKKVEEQKRKKEKVEAIKKSFEANRPKYDAIYKDNSISDLRKAELIYKPQVERIAKWYSQSQGEKNVTFIGVKVSLKGSSIKEGVIIKVSYIYYIDTTLKYRAEKRDIKREQNFNKYLETSINDRKYNLLNGIIGEFKYYAVFYDPVSISVDLTISRP